MMTYFFSHDLQESWSPTGKPMVPKNHTHLRQGFGGSSAGERNPPKHGRSVAERVPIRSYAFLHGQGRGLLRRRMKICMVRPATVMLAQACLLKFDEVMS